MFRVVDLYNEIEKNLVIIKVALGFFEFRKGGLPFANRVLV
jgi:hypothetical protein